MRAQLSDHCQSAKQLLATWSPPLVVAGHCQSVVTCLGSRANDGISRAVSVMSDAPREFDWRLVAERGLRIKYLSETNEQDVSLFRIQFQKNGNSQCTSIKRNAARIYHSVEKVDGCRRPPKENCSQGHCSLPVFPRHHLEHCLVSIQKMYVSTVKYSSS